VCSLGNWPRQATRDGIAVRCALVKQRGRYLDALLVDADRNPWAIELKDQVVGGGHGSYLRDGIAQAVLHRHYIRSVDVFDRWFDHHGLRRKGCRAALAFPVASPGTERSMVWLRALAVRHDVEIIRRPGTRREDRRGSWGTSRDEAKRRGRRRDARRQDGAAPRPRGSIRRRAVAQSMVRGGPRL